jgi:hypothetical protein
VKKNGGILVFDAAGCPIEIIHAWNRTMWSGDDHERKAARGLGAPGK